MNQLEQPSNLSGIIVALDEAIQSASKVGIQQAAIRIAYGILYGNNRLNIEDFFREYPELQAIAELAVELDMPQGEEYSKELWGALVSNFELIKRRVA